MRRKNQSEPLKRSDFGIKDKIVQYIEYDNQISVTQPNKQEEYKYYMVDLPLITYGKQNVP
jgi:hypothetical protein